MAHGLCSIDANPGPGHSPCAENIGEFQKLFRLIISRLRPCLQPPLAVGLLGFRSLVFVFLNASVRWFLDVSFQALFPNNCDFRSGCSYFWCPDLSGGRPGACVLAGWGHFSTLGAPWEPWKQQTGLLGGVTFFRFAVGFRPHVGRSQAKLGFSIASFMVRCLFFPSLRHPILPVVLFSCFFV